MKTTRSELNWAIMGRMWSLERIGENGCGRMRASSRRGPGADLSGRKSRVLSLLWSRISCEACISPFTYHCTCTCVPIIVHAGSRTSIYRVSREEDP